MQGLRLGDRAFQDGRAFILAAGKEKGQGQVSSDPGTDRSDVGFVAVRAGALEDGETRGDLSTDELGPAHGPARESLIEGRAAFVDDGGTALRGGGRLYQCAPIRVGEGQEAFRHDAIQSADVRSPLDVVRLEPLATRVQ